MSNEPIVVTPQDAALELLARKRARENLIDFSIYTKPGYVADRFHRIVARELEMIESGENDRLMIFAPPQHGKSELSTRRFPAYALARNPQLKIISASYNADFAKGFGRDVRDIVEGKEFSRLFPQTAIRSDNRSADEWSIENGGTYFAVGVGSATTGRGANLFLIDDPIKDRKEADSAVTRQTHWDWYTDVVFTRLQEKSAIILTLTRWHHDDLAGRLLRLQEEGRGRPWRVLRLPALPEAMRGSDGEYIVDSEGRVPGDPLNRVPEEPLAPNRFSYGTLLEKQDVMGERSWSAMYQQRPIALDGGMFRGSWFKEATELPPKRSKVRAWDLAASSKGDYTVGTLMSRCSKGVFYIEDVIRFRGTAFEVEDKILKTAKNDGRGVKIIIPEDPGQAGKAQAMNFSRKLAGYNVKVQRPSGSKETRATAFAAQVENGNVMLSPIHPWKDAFIQELETFPLGSNDDQVDATADAFNALIGPRRAAVMDW
jgi:predicted phage terminase large subunit-like protein